jgi:hypothetical protein
MLFYLRFFFMMVSFGSFYAWGNSSKSSGKILKIPEFLLSETEKITLVTQEHHLKTLLDSIYLNMVQLIESLKSDSLHYDKLLELRKTLPAPSYLDEILLEFYANFQEKKAKIDKFIEFTNRIQTSSTTDPANESLSNVIINNLSDLPIFKSLVFKTKSRTTGTPNFPDLVKVLSDSDSDVFFEDKDLYPLSLETLNIKQLLIILNNYLNKKRRMHRNKKYYQYLSDVEVPGEILIKILLNIAYPIQIKALITIFNGRLYQELTKFLIQYADTFHINPKFIDNYSETISYKQLKLISTSKEFETFFNSEQQMNIKLFVDAVFNNGEPLTTKQIFESIPRIGEAPVVIKSVWLF